jgi:hypothetical protein
MSSYKGGFIIEQQYRSTTFGASLVMVLQQSFNKFVKYVEKPIIALCKLGFITFQYGSILKIPANFWWTFSTSDFYPNLSKSL